MTSAQELYGKNSSKELTKKEASNLIEYLEKLENGDAEWMSGEDYVPEEEERPGREPGEDDE